MDDGTNMPLIGDIKIQDETVRDWIGKLGLLGGFSMTTDCRFEHYLCGSWIALFSHLSSHSSRGITARRYWLGARMFLNGESLPDDPYHAVRIGYNAAKAAFEAQQQPEPANSVTVSQGMASMPWADFSELTEKAALCDTLKAENARLKVKADAFDTSLCEDSLEVQRKAAAWDSLMETIENLKIGVKS